MFANDAENDQRGGEHRAKGNELAALGFEKIISFEALPSSEYVLSTAENYVLYVLLEALASGTGGGAGGARLPLNLGIVIDRSGSMYDERRLEFVIEAVKLPCSQYRAGRQGRGGRLRR